MHTRYGHPRVNAIYNLDMGKHDKIYPKVSSGITISFNNNEKAWSLFIAKLREIVFTRPLIVRHK